MKEKDERDVLNGYFAFLTLKLIKFNNKYEYFLKF